MSRFTSALNLRLLEDENGKAVTKGGRCQWVVIEPLVYDVGDLGSGETIIVPVGATTDLASIPFGVRGLLPPDGPWAKAAVVHDALYRTNGTLKYEGTVYRSRLKPYSRAEADRILEEAMRVVGVPQWKRALIYRAVWAFGGRGWGS